MVFFCSCIVHFYKDYKQYKDYKEEEDSHE